MKIAFWKIAVLLLTVASVVSFGQTAAGTLTGVVTDATGAVMADVPVVAVHVDTGTRIVGVTSDTGNYTIAQMPVGKYTVTVERQGFKTYRRENVTIAAAQALRLDMSMEVGAASESVTVTAETTLLQSDSGALVKNINPQQIQNLPVLPTTTFIRDPLALALTLPGAVSGGTGFAPRINGLNSADNQYKIDGEPVTNVGANTITTRNNVSPDAIQEVAIQSSNFTAEYGSVSGALFNMIIKSGTNQYHGTMYDYLANDKFNADDAGSHTRSRIRRNDYGFNVGGPVRIPKIYNGKDKTFFFFNWEQYRDYNTFLSNINPVPTVPTQAYRDGDFSSLFAAAGSNTLQLNGHAYKDPFGNTIQLGTVFDPRSTQFNVPCPASGSDCTPGSLLTVRSPFVGNIVPKTLQDAVALKTLGLVPLPAGNANAVNGLPVNNYLNGIHAARITRSPALKIDQNIGAKARLGFTWNDNHTASPIQTVAPGAFAEGFPEPITTNSGTFEASPTFRVNFDYNIKPTMLFHLGVGWQEFNFCACPVTQAYDAAAGLGLTYADGSHLPLSSFPVFGSTIVGTPQLGGLKNLSTGGPGYNLERHPSSSANVTWIRGNHTVKFGADARINMFVVPSLTNVVGNYGFGGSTATALSGNGITWQPSLNGLAGFTGNSGAVGFPFANFLMGSVTNMSIGAPAEYRKSKQQWGVYLQDTWRISRKLTLDYGIRWDYGTYAHEDYGRAVDLSLTTPNPAADGRLGGYIYEGTCNCKFAQNYPFAIGPRIGIAYTLDSKTVIRGGVGLAYGATPFTGGGIINSFVTPTLPNGFDAFKLASGVPTQFRPTWATSDPSAAFVAGTVNNSQASLIDPNAGRPDRTTQWNLSLQRELTRNTVIEVAYVGNRNVWAPTGGFLDYNAISVAQLQKYGFTVDGSAQGIADQKVLNSRWNQLTQAQISTLASHGVVSPYPSFPTSGIFVSTVLQSIKNFPQFSGGIAPAQTLGRSWYDSLQVTLTKRFSHGLSATGGYTFSKNLAWNGPTDIFNPDANTAHLGKDVSGANPPQILRISFEYQVPRYKGNMPVLGNKLVSYVLGDWALSSALYYQTAGYLGRPLNGAANPINLWTGRGPGPGAVLKKNADGTFMNPWSVNWTDLAGNKHTDPLDINCHCFDPNTTVVLNPAAWQTIPDASWTSDTSTYTFFRGSRRPTEAMNFARNFKIKERYNLQIRMEFQNVFNRVQIPNPSLGFNVASNLAYNCSGVGSNSTNCNGTAVNGGYTTGFGTLGQLTNGGLLGPPRSGQLIARFTF